MKGKHFKNPLTLLWVAVVICALRWVTIANGYDYGWDFETGYRVFEGGTYGVDFYTALGPLSYEIIGLVFKMVGPRWIVIYLIAYTSWVLTLVGVYQLLKIMTSDKLCLALALLLVAPLSIPHLVALHNYNFLAFLLAVWSGVCFFKYLESKNFLCWVLAGSLCALSVFSKQNIGMGVSLLIFIMLFSTFLFDPSVSARKSIVGALVFLLTFLSMSGLLFYFFSRSLGANELWRLMFTDAAQAKGSWLNMLKTAIPRMTFGTSNEHNLKWAVQHIAEGFFFLIAFGINFILFRGALSGEELAQKSKTEPISKKDFAMMVCLFMFLLFLPLLIPSTIFAVREKYYWFDEKYRISQLVLAFGSWVVLIGEGFYLFLILRSSARSWQKNFKKIFLLTFSLGISFFVCSSRFTYLYLTMALFGGCFFVSTLSLGLWSRRTLIFVATIIWVGIYFCYPTHALGRMVRLEGSQLSGLWFAESDRSFVELYTQKLKPYVEGKRTLWLSMGGPHSLSEGVPVKNISNLYFDQFNSRIEESLVRDWMTRPPEMIIRYWYALPGDSVWLNSSYFEDWLKKNYVQVAEIEGRKVLKYRF